MPQHIDPNLSQEDTQAMEEFQRFLKWAGGPFDPGQYRELARNWYEGLLTTEEGQRIEDRRQVWQCVEVAS